MLVNYLYIFNQVKWIWNELDFKAFLGKEMQTLFFFKKKERVTTFFFFLPIRKRTVLRLSVEERSKADQQDPPSLIAISPDTQFCSIRIRNNALLTRSLSIPISKPLRNFFPNEFNFIPIQPSLACLRHRVSAQSNSLLLKQKK